MIQHLLRAYLLRGGRSIFLFCRLLALCLKGRIKTTILILVLAFILGLLPTLISELTARLANSTVALLQAPSVAGNMRTLVVFLLLVSLFRFTFELLQSIYTHLRFVLGTHFSKRIEDALIKKQSQLPIEVYDDSDYLDRQSRANSRAHGIPQDVLTTVLSLFENNVAMLGALIVLLTISPFLPLLALLSSFVGMFGSARVARSAYVLNRNRTQRVRRENYCGSLLSGKHNMTYNLLFGLFDFFQKEYQAYRGITIQENIRQDLRRNIWLSLQALASNFLYACAYALALIVVLDSGGKYGEILMCGILYVQIESSLKSVGHGLVAFYEQRLFMEDLFDVLDKNLSRTHNIGRIPTPSIVESLSFEHVSFKYPGCSNYVLEDVSLSLKLGEMGCLVGLNGTGKTTIVNLLTRMYQPTTGIITINGINLNEFEENSLWKLFGVVTQILPSYYYSLYDNIRFGDVEREQVKAHIQHCCEINGLDHIAAKLHSGYGTMLGRTFYGGEELSYGQWKSIALARVDYKTASIRIYDEPTAGLDPLAERNLLNTVVAAKKDRITLIVSHTMTVAKEADQVFLVHQGRIIENGPHSQLISKNGEYSKLYMTQAKLYWPDPLND